MNCSQVYSARTTSVHYNLLYFLTKVSVASRLHSPGVPVTFYWYLEYANICSLCGVELVGFSFLNGKLDSGIKINSSQARL